MSVEVAVSAMQTRALEETVNSFDFLELVSLDEDTKDSMTLSVVANSSLCASPGPVGCQRELGQKSL